MKTYRAALIGCSRMGAFIDNEVSADMYPYSHAAGYEACGAGAGGLFRQDERGEL